jgi:hypothetical protein
MEMIKRSFFAALAGVLSMIHRAITEALIWCEDRYEDRSEGIWTNEDADDFIMWIEEQHRNSFERHDRHNTFVDGPRVKQ